MYSTITRHKWFVSVIILFCFSFFYNAFSLTQHQYDLFFYDEGVYLYVAKSLLEGYVPYQDFMFTHPPGLEFLEAIGFKVFGPNILAIRMAYLTLVLASVFPLYGIARKLTNKQEIGFLAVLFFLVSTELSQRYFREIMRETSMLPFLISAIYLYVTGSARARFGAGMLLAAAALIKLTGILFIPMLLILDLWNRRRLSQVFWLLAGSAVVFIPVMGFLTTIPGFADNILMHQVTKYRVPITFRVKEIMLGALSDPVPFALGFLAFAVLTIKRKHENRLLLLWIGFLTPVIVLNFNSFFLGYLIPVIPGLVLAAAVLVVEGYGRLRAQYARTALLSVAALISLVPAAATFEGEITEGRGKTVQVGIGWSYVKTEPGMIELLQSREGYIFTYFPIFALHAGREMHPWYWDVEFSNYLTNFPGPEEINEVILGSSTVLLPQDPWFLERMPAESIALIQKEFYLAYQDEYFRVFENPNR